MKRILLVLVMIAATISPMAANHVKFKQRNNTQPITRTPISYITIETDQLVVNFPDRTSGECKFIVYNKYGQKVMEETKTIVHRQSLNLYVLSLPLGDYTIEVEEPNGFTTVEFEIED